MKFFNGKVNSLVSLLVLSFKILKKTLHKVKKRGIYRGELGIFELGRDDDNEQAAFLQKTPPKIQLLERCGLLGCSPSSLPSTWRPSTRARTNIYSGRKAVLYEQRKKMEMLKQERRVTLPRCYDN